MQITVLPHNQFFKKIWR